MILYAPKDAILHILKKYITNKFYYEDKVHYAYGSCSPEESSFTALFSDMKITECAWKAHDGQQPDEE